MNIRCLLVTFLFLLQQNLQAVDDYWKAEEYHQHSSSQKDAAKDLMHFIRIYPDSNILDVGCGDGKITAAISQNIPNGSILGVDISPSMISFAQSTFPKDLYPNLDFALKDAQELDFVEEFDIVFSFTTQQWVEHHNAFLEGARRALRQSGLLAVCMPMGLPTMLEQAVNEVMALPEWSCYFDGFTTGWYFVEAEDYEDLLSLNQLMPLRLAVVPQIDIFPSRAVFQKFIGQWFPYLRPLPDAYKETFLDLVIDRFLELESPFPHGEVHFIVRRLEVIAIK